MTLGWKRENTSVSRCANYPLKMLGNNDKKWRLIRDRKQEVLRSCGYPKRSKKMPKCVTILSCFSRLEHKHNRYKFTGETGDLERTQAS